VIERREVNDDFVGVVFKFFDVKIDGVVVQEVCLRGITVFDWKTQRWMVKEQQ
jgi:hypothetical protein